MDLEENYEIGRTVTFIRTHNFARVALQIQLMAVVVLMRLGHLTLMRIVSFIMDIHVSAEHQLFLHYLFLAKLQLVYLTVQRIYLNMHRRIASLFWFFMDWNMHMLDRILGKHW